MSLKDKIIECVDESIYESVWRPTLTSIDLSVGKVINESIGPSARWSAWKAVYGSTYESVTMTVQGAVKNKVNEYDIVG